MLLIILGMQKAFWETMGAWFFISLMLLIVCGFGYLLFGEFRIVPLDSPASSQDSEALRQRWVRQLSEAAAQQERNRLARDLHDSIKQQIFSVSVAAATAQTRWESDPEGARRAIADVRGAAREAMAEMEAMLQHLRPAPLENVGLIEALRKQCEALQYRSGATVTAEFGELPDNEILPPGTQEAICSVFSSRGGVDPTAILKRSAFPGKNEGDEKCALEEGSDAGLVWLPAWGLFYGGLRLLGDQLESSE